MLHNLKHLWLSNNKLRELPVDEVKTSLKLTAQNYYKKLKITMKNSVIAMESLEHYGNYHTVLREAS